MNIVIQKKAPASPGKSNYLNYQKLGFWATVTEVNSQTNTCTVLSSNKEIIRNIPVTTKEWISDDSKERDLPPIGSFVFILMPDNCLSNAFILCSGYPKGEAALQTLYAKDKDEKKEKDSLREKITPSHWNVKEDYVSGTKSLTSPDAKIEITATLENKESRKLTIKAFDKVITLNADGVSIKASKDISIETSGNMNLKANSFNFNDGALEITNG